MDGETALRYARTRHQSSDFDRAERQQQVALALVQRLLEPSAWLRWPAVAAAFAQTVATDLQPWELPSLVPTFLRVGPDGIKHYVIDEEMTTPFTTESGGQVLLPRWERIRPLVAEVTGAGD
jgi:anionic cell wall polymer biosynthesis LytR-Cps2A-Psr (LCP) family protein